MSHTHKHDHRGVRYASARVRKRRTPMDLTLLGTKHSNAYQFSFSIQCQAERGGQVTSVTSFARMTSAKPSLTTLLPSELCLRVKFKQRRKMAAINSTALPGLICLQQAGVAHVFIIFWVKECSIPNEQHYTSL